VAAVVCGLVVLGWLTEGVTQASLVLIPLTVLIAKLTGRYDHEEVVLRKSTLDETPALLMLAAILAVAWSAVAGIARIDTGRGSTAVLWVSMSIALVIARAAARALARRMAPAERIVIVGPAAARTRLARQLDSDHNTPCEIVGFLPLEDERVDPSDWGSLDRRMRRFTVRDLESVIHERNAQRVVVIPAGADSEAIADVVAQANTVGAKVSMVPGVLEVVGSAVEFDEVSGLTVLSVRRPGLGRSSRVLKRATDIIGALVALTILAPLGLLIALAIRLDSPGPVLFRQRRIGRDGKEFEMVKFRSMVESADAQRAGLEELNESSGIFKLARDPRVTRVGRFLRRSSLDEAPQLINVLRGEMSLVGPRPLIPDEDRLVEGRLRKRLQLAPGMTGPWQVLGPERPPLSEMVKIDFLYAANWSVWSDVKIVLRTLSHVVGLRGV
jgi:exopolysaccharide biosynthesis polyprenyl glycosylphosphotransferase